MGLEITRGLFGLDIPDSADQDFKDAVTFAQLSPEQSVRASGMMSGQMLGRGIGQGIGALAGLATGVDVRTPDAKRKAAEMRVVESIKRSGIDPNDPAAYMPLVIKAFQDEGLTEDALKAATAFQSMKMGNLKTMAEAEGKLAEAAKDRAEAANKGVSWLQNGMANGIIDPPSVKKYLASGNLDDLKFRGKYDATAQIIGADGKVYQVAYNKDNPADMHMLGEAESKHADPTRGTAAKVNIVNGLLRKYGYTEGGDVGEALRKMKETNAGDYNMYVSHAKELVGADNLDEMLRTGVFKVTEEERKTLLQAEAGYRAVRDFKQMWGNKTPPMKRADVAAAVSEVEATSETKDIPANIALRKIEDVAVRNYIIAVAKMAYPRLRLETGAAISSTEWANVLRNILPYADDSKEARDLKIRTALDQNKALYVLANTTSKAAPNVFKALFPGEDIESMYKTDTPAPKPKPSAAPANDNTGGGDLISRAKAVAGKDAATRKQFWDSLTPDEKEQLKPYLKR